MIKKVNNNNNKKTKKDAKKASANKKGNKMAKLFTKTLNVLSKKVYPGVKKVLGMFFKEWLKPLYDKMLPFVVLFILYYISSKLGFCDNSSGKPVCEFPEFKGLGNIIDSLLP